jgi:hypothetical protein
MASGVDLLWRQPRHFNNVPGASCGIQPALCRSALRWEERRWLCLRSYRRQRFGSRQPLYFGERPSCSVLTNGTAALLDDHFQQVLAREPRTGHADAIRSSDLEPVNPRNFGTMFTAADCLTMNLQGGVITSRNQATSKPSAPRSSKRSRKAAIAGAVRHNGREGLASRNASWNIKRRSDLFRTRGGEHEAWDNRFGGGLRAVEYLRSCTTK